MATGRQTSTRHARPIPTREDTTIEVVLGILGLALALYQVRKAEKAALAAKRAVESRVAQSNIYSLLLLIPEVAMVERELSRAARADEVNETQRLIRDWLARASELNGLLKEHDSGTSELMTKVQESIALGTSSQNTLNKASAKPSSSTRILRERASEVVGLARTEGARLRAHSPSIVTIPTLADDLRSFGNYASRPFRKRSK